jgi:two-component system, OmpR family, manganese sensing sensor histidine kinase
MDLDIGLNPINSQTIRRMITSNLIVIILVLLVFSLGVYLFSMNEANDEERDRLILFNGSMVSSIDPGEYEPDLLSATRSEPTTVPLNDMNIEWYSPEGKFLMELGALKLVPPFRKDAGFELQAKPHALILTTPAVVRGKLYGYVRTGESLGRWDAELVRLLKGLLAGILVSLVVIGVGSLWLTRQSLRPIEQAYFRMRRFTDDASHELRSPLMAVKSNIELVLKRAVNLEPEYQNNLVIVQNAVDQMSNLTEELLHLATADQDQLSAERSVVDLHELLEGVISENHAKAEEKKIAISRKFKEEVLVQGSRQDLRGIFSNILRNALTYTPENGKVEVEVTQLNGSAIARITDNGIGIASSDIPRVFDRFWRADKARDQSGGAGLGLAIASRLVRRNGGEIRVDSTLGKGSTFTVTLPAAVAS